MRKRGEWFHSMRPKPPNRTEPSVDKIRRECSNPYAGVNECYGDLTLIAAVLVLAPSGSVVSFLTCSPSLPQFGWTVPILHVSMLAR
jgi:hypothetical protein